MAGRLLLLARTVLLLLLISVAAAAFPFQPWSPVWFLRLSQLLIDYSPALVLSLGLALLASFYEPKAQRSERQRTLGRRLAAIGLWVYGVLIPVQMLSYGWLWLDSASQLKGAISDAESRVAPLRSRISGAADETTLLSVMSNGRPLPPLPADRPPLAAQKREFLAAVDRDLSNLRTRLEQQRRQQLTSLLVGTLRGVAGAAVVAGGLLAVKRLS